MAKLRSAPKATWTRPIGSPRAVVSPCTSTARPARRTMSRNAVREGFRPTPSISTEPPGVAGGKRHPERRTRDVARDRRFAGVQTLAALMVTAFARHVHGDAERVQRPFRVIAGRRPFDHGRDALGLQAGQQHRAFDLGARHIRAIGDRRAARRRRSSAAAARRPS